MSGAGLRPPDRRLPRWPSFVSYGFAAISVVVALTGGWWSVSVSALCVVGSAGMLFVDHGLYRRAKRAVSAATLREVEREFDQAKSKAGRITVLPPSVSFAPTAQEAGENLLMAFGHQLPSCEPIGPCPRCGIVAAHLIRVCYRQGHIREAGRTCQSCNHQWRQRLDD